MKAWIGSVVLTSMVLVGCGADPETSGSSTALDASTDAAQGMVELDGSSGPQPQQDGSQGSADSGTTVANDLGAADTGVIDPPAGAVCPSVNFMDLSDVEGPGASYDMPVLDVSCDEDTVTVNSNGLPHFAFQAITPNDLQAQDFNWTFPLHPELAAERTDIPLLGTVAIAINGCPIYGPNEAEIPHPYGDPIYNEILDWNQGHTGGNGDYHFHALLTGTFYPEYVEGEVSPILAYSLDGFPIYGPYGCVDQDEGCAESGDIVKFESSWEVTGDPTTYAWDNHACTAESCEEAIGHKLDRCNGRVGPDGTYRYHATDGFPYVLGCYRGTAAGAGQQGGPGGGQGGPGGGQVGPASCEQEADCEGLCLEGSVSCTCHTTPMGNQICVPTCESAEDCPTMANGGAMNCTPSGVCIPAGGPQGGGGGGGGP